MSKPGLEVCLAFAVMAGLLATVVLLDANETKPEARMTDRELLELIAVEVANNLADDEPAKRIRRELAKRGIATEPPTEWKEGKVISR